MAPSGAGSPPSVGVHHPGRDLGLDRPDRPLGPEDGLRAGPRVAGDGLSPRARFRQPIGKAVPAGKARGPGDRSLAASGIEASSLDLEITESSAMQSAELTINTLLELKRLGVAISLDDFGTGYSSLNYLKRFPIDRVKLDQSFVRDMTRNPEDAAIVRAVISMAHTLKLVVVAEGVETEDQLAFLRHHRCDEIQGFLFSPPVEAIEFRKLLLRKQALTAVA